MAPHLLENIRNRVGNGRPHRVSIDWDRNHATFEKKAEGRNGQPQSCPR